MLDVDIDYRLMAKWRNDPRVLEWYGGRDKSLNFEAARLEYGRRVRGEGPTQACIIEKGGVPIGYLQHYRVDDPDEYQLSDVIDCFGIDLFIGEVALWGQGLGTRVVALMVGHLFERHGARRVVIDPQVSNARAIAAYEKVGFTKLKILRSHEVHEGQPTDAWLMVVTPSTFKRTSSPPCPG
jgi:aminoglycoside 6'-N-acetyltransferase